MLQNLFGEKFMLFLSEVEWESEVHPGQQAVWEETVGSE
jgi:hypothetical protein